MSGLDFATDGEVFRKDHRVVIARNRQLASIVGVRLAYNASGYKAGQVLARNNVSGLYQNYAPAGASGTDTATGVLFSDVIDMPASSTDLGQMIIKGEVYETALTGLDAAAKVDLSARSVIDGSGVSILLF